MIRYITGDVLAGANFVVAHGCSTDGAFRNGMAKQIRRRFPWAHDEYKSHYRDWGFGQFFGSGRDGVMVLHLMVQDGPYPDRLAIAIALMNAMVGLREMTKRRTLRIPWIGCGTGGFNRGQVQGIFEAVAAAVHEVNLEVYSLGVSR